MKNRLQHKEQTPSLNELNLSIARANFTIKLIGFLFKILLFSSPVWGFYFVLKNKLNNEPIISGVVLLIVGAIPIMLSKNLDAIGKIILIPVYLAASFFVMFFVMLVAVGSA